MSGPLHSIKIIEMAGLGPAPLAGQLLADLGAEVIVIDRSSGQDLSKDVNRRGKQSIALNLKDPKAVSIVLKMLSDADILIEGFRPGVMERLGLGPQETLNANSRLIYGRMTGWGQSGPLSKTAGHDINYMAITGALHAMGKRGEPPVPPLNLVADYGGGSMFLIMGLLAALIERGVSGKGQVVDAAMSEGVPAMMGLIQGMLGQGSWTEKREDNFIDGGAPYYRCYRTSDDRFLAVGAIEPQFYAELLKLLSLDMALCKTQNDKFTWRDAHALFESTFATKTRDEWMQIFEGSDACVAPVLNFEEAATYPHNQERGTFFSHNGVTQTAVAPRFSRNHPLQPQAGEISGADGRSVLKSLGLSEPEIADLERGEILL